MKQIYASVHDGDFTVWVVTNGHAWPFSTVEDALWALPDVEALPDEQQQGWVSDDEGFRESIAEEDRGWDRVPEASDGDLVAALLQGVAS